MEYCYDLEQTTKYMVMHRVEYCEYVIRRENKKKRVWFQGNVCVISSEDLSSNLVTLFMYVEGKLDNVYVSSLMSVVNRFMAEMNHKGKRIIMLQSVLETPNTSIKYRIVEKMTMKTEIKYRSAFWDMFLNIKIKIGNEEVMEKFKVIRDRYTINRGLLKIIKIKNQYDEEVSFNDLYNEIPSITELDSIFQTNNWALGKLYKSPDDTEKEKEDSMRALKEFNESMAVSHLISSMEKMVERGDFSKMLKMEEENYENAEVMETFNKNTSESINVSSNITGMAQMMNFEEILSNLKHYEEDDDTFNDRDYFLNERSSLHSVLMTLMERAVRSKLMFDLVIMMKLWNRACMNQMIRNFHNRLLNQIAEMFPDISDISLNIIYNIAIRFMNRRASVKPYNDLMLDRESSSGLDNPMICMVKQIKNNEMEEDELDMFLMEARI
jgi:hypothetical protein